MYAIRRILHPTDFSEPATAALEVAISMAEEYGAELSLLHVCEPLMVMAGEGFPQIPPNDAEEALARLNSIEVPLPPGRLFRHLVVGEPAAEIVREANEGSCDLIVMGTHGRTGLNRLLMGSVAEGVSRHAPCPVLTVREIPRRCEIDRVARKRELARA